MYTAAVLAPTSAHLLRWIMKGTANLEKDGFVLETEQGQELPHHMTINMGRFNKKLNPELSPDTRMIIRIDKLVYSDVLGICAANVTEAKAILFRGDIITVNTINKHPHITVCIKSGTKPVMANDLLDRPSPHTIEVELDQIYTLEATIQEVQ